MLKAKKVAVLLLVIGLPLATGHGEKAEDSLIIQTPGRHENSDGNPKRSQRDQKSDPSIPLYRWGVGVNYTGAQIRYNLSSHWAAEGRYQQGKASSNYGDVTSRVFGLRGYRTPHPEKHLPFYYGGELAYARAEPETSVYKTVGFATGAFGGFEYHLTRRMSLTLDLGPYIIALTETHTHTQATNLDFILNTTFLLRLF